MRKRERESEYWKDWTPSQGTVLEEARCRNIQLKNQESSSCSDCEISNKMYLAKVVSPKKINL